MRKTKALIIEGFAQLLEQRPINKITVKDIVEHCDINRNTFYYHFQDIPALLQQIMQEKADALIQNHCVLGRPMDCIKPALQYGKAHKQAVLHVYHGVPRETFLFYLNRLTKRLVEEYFASVSKTVPLDPADAAVLSRYYKGTVIGCLLDWLEADMQYDLEAEIERLCVLMDGAGEKAVQMAVRHL